MIDLTDYDYDDSVDPMRTCKVEIVKYDHKSEYGTEKVEYICKNVRNDQVGFGLNLVLLNGDLVVIGFNEIVEFKISYKH